MYPPRCNGSMKADTAKQGKMHTYKSKVNVGALGWLSGLSVQLGFRVDLGVVGSNLGILFLSSLSARLILSLSNKNK